MHTEKAKKTEREEEEDGGSRRQVHLQETAENGRAGDQNITYIDIDSDHEKSSEIRKTVETYIGLCSLYRTYSFIGSPLIYRSHRSVSTLCRLAVGCHR